ncbi:MAG: hypothetical protein OEY77_06000 [Nitrospira sp.]|nr:hypothetical protein [Nitrospira sp.]
MADPTYGDVFFACCVRIEAPLLIANEAALSTGERRSQSATLKIKIGQAFRIGSSSAPNAILRPEADGTWSDYTEWG